MMQQYDLISVIVPIYKVEPYIHKCLASLLAQTYPNLEIILVDDGSPDRCGAICDEYRAKHGEEIKVIHKKNGGLSDARNAGIEAASGGYIAFVDSDDFVHQRMLEILYHNLKTAAADISICAFQKVYHMDATESPVTDSDNLTTICSGEQAMWNLFDKELERITTLAWNKLYKTGLFKDVRYPAGRNMEDVAIIHQLLYQAKTVVYTKLPLYYYYVRGDSIMGTVTLSWRDALMASQDRQAFFRQRDRKELLAAEGGEYMRLMIWFYVRISYHSPDESQALAELRSLFSDYFSQTKASGKAVPVRYRLFFYAPGFYTLLWKFIYRYQGKGKLSVIRVRGTE